MPDVLLFGATGYTGSLTAHALARRGADVVLAGRDPGKLETLAAETGATDIARVEVGDVEGLTAALTEVGALITCVGPFWKLGHTAAEAAIQAGVHYVDSTGEIAFIDELVERYGGSARARGIVMAPALGFDEVPSDVSLSLAIEGMATPSAVVTYAMPSKASMGTIRTIVSGIGGKQGRWIHAGKPIQVPTAQRTRWSPMPPPLGPKYAVSMPVAEGALAPLHLEIDDLELYTTVPQPFAFGMRVSMPLVRMALNQGLVQRVVDSVIGGRRGGPDESQRRRDKWTVLAEARSGTEWRNVALQGTDPYGLTAETLAAGALKLARDGHEDAGVMAPVQAVGLENLQKELIDLGVDIHVYEPS